MLASLDTIHGTGCTENHQTHQSLSVKREECGEIFLPALRQQSLQTGFFLHQTQPRLTSLSTGSITCQPSVILFNLYPERVESGIAVIKNTTAQSPDHQCHCFFRLMYQRRLDCQRAL
ncbi:hypothetical protein F9V30_22090 [Escherichia coli]|nr:hypothetical protein [Escherichia coli]